MTCDLRVPIHTPYTPIIHVSKKHHHSIKKFKCSMIVSRREKLIFQRIASVFTWKHEILLLLK